MYPTRDELDETYTWDLTRIYESPAEWEAAAEDLSERIEAIETWSGPTDSPTALAEALEAIETVLVTESRLELYAQLRRNEDTDDQTRRDRRQRARRLASEVTEAVQLLRGRIQRDAGWVRDHLDDPELEGWEAYLEDLLALAPYTRDADTEGVIGAFEPVVETQTDPVLAVTAHDFDPPTVEGPEGDPFEVDRTTFGEAMDSPDRAFRKRAHGAYFDELGEREHALAATVAQKVRAHAALVEVRGYDSVREMALSRPSYPETGIHVTFPESAHEAVIDRVREHLDPYHDLLESRREQLGVDRLRPYDANAPLVEGDPPELSYEQLREHLLAAVEPLGEDYRERLRAFLEERRVDVYPTERKRTDVPAYCPSSPETGAFVLANFREDVRTAFYLAHELGHAMHVEQLRATQPPRYVTIPRPVSEVPSLLHELLLAEYLLEAGDPSLAPFVRERRASLLSGNVYGAGRSGAFLHELYRTVEDGGDLTPDRAAELYEDVAGEFRGPIEPTEPGAGWRRESYARDPYHNYQYVTGAVGAVSVFQRLRSGDLSTDTYLDFLRNSGRRDSLTSFEALGVDVGSSEPYERLGEELDAVRVARSD